jgi:hypothetical protein
MRYKFKALNLREELKAAVGDKPVKVTDSGAEMILDFGKATLTPTEETALAKLMETKPMLRGKTAKFIEKGTDIVITPSKGAPV